MIVAGTAVWLFVIGLLLHGLRHGRPPVAERAAGRVILWAGAVFPSTAVLGLLVFGLWLMPSLRPFAGTITPSMTIEISGRQYWWRVTYHLPNQPKVVSANEVRLPAGRRVELKVSSQDVIHSFWIPALAGKMDMIPGRINRLSMLAEKPGIYRGPCAEFCGSSHALMALSAVVMEPSDFDEWLQTEAQSAQSAGAPGGKVFVRHGCGSCHTVAGTGTRGNVGPNLSHLGSRITLGAGILENTTDNIARFIAEPDRIKPGVKMPAFGMLPPEDIQAIAAWLNGLQ